MASKDQEGLEVSIEISHQRMMKRVAQVEARLLGLANKADKAFKKTNAAAVKGFDRTSKASGRMTGNLRNMSQQLSQVVQQAQAGTNAFTALAMQIPDMVAFAGPLVVVLGAIAGGLATIAINAMEAGDSVDYFEDQMSTLERLLKDIEEVFSQQGLSIEEMTSKYGEQAGEIQKVINKQAELIALRARDALTEATATSPDQIDALTAYARQYEAFMKNRETMDTNAKRNMEGLVDVLETRMADALDINADAVSGLSAAFNDLAGAEGAEEVREALMAVYEQIEASGVEMDKLDKETREWLESLNNSVERLALVETAMGEVLDTASSVGTALKTWTLGSDFASGALKSVQELWAAVRGRAETAGGAPKPRTSRGGKQKSPADIAGIGDKMVTDLERQIKIIDKTDAAIASLTTKWRLLDAAKAAGVDVNSRVAATGKTVAETIDEQAAKVGELTQKYDTMAERAAFFEDTQQTLNKGLIDATLYGKDFGDVLDNLAKKLAEAALQAALFGTGPFGGMLGGGLFPTAAGGNSARAGRPMLVNENTPHSEVFVPSSNGGVLNVAQAQTALKQAAGAGGSKTQLEVIARSDPGVILEISERASANQIATYDAQMPAKVNGINKDPRSV